MALIIRKESQEAMNRAYAVALVRGVLAELIENLLYLHSYAGGEHCRVTLFPTSPEELYFDILWESRTGHKMISEDEPSGTWKWEKMMNGGLVYREGTIGERHFTINT